MSDCRWDAHENDEINGENLADAVRQLARVMVIFCVLTLALGFCLWRQRAPDALVPGDRVWSLWHRAPAF